MCPWHARKDEDEIWDRGGRLPEIVGGWSNDVTFPSLENSCYVPIEDILDIEEE